MHSTASQRTRSTSNPHPVQPSAISARQVLTLKTARPSEDAAKTDSDRVAANAAEAIDPREFARAQQILQRQESTIRALEERLLALQDDRAKLIEQLRARELELSELGALLLPSPALPATPDPAIAGTTAAERPLPCLRRILIDEAPVTLRPGAHTSRPPCADPTAHRELEFVEECAFYADIDQNLSRGGVFVRTYRRFRIGTSLELTIELDDGSMFAVRGEVSWCFDPQSGSSRPGVGIAFTSLSNSALSAIERLCRARDVLYVEL